MSPACGIWTSSSVAPAPRQGGTRRFERCADLRVQQRREVAAQQTHAKALQPSFLHDAWRAILCGPPSKRIVHDPSVVTERHSGPTWSIVVLSGTTPSSGISPSDGLSPTRPQAADGMRTEPPVSVPIDAYAIPSITPAAEPPEDPPGERFGIERMANQAERRVLIGRAERKLVEIGLAKEHGAGLAQARHDDRVVSRNMAVPVHCWLPWSRRLGSR